MIGRGNGRRGWRRAASPPRRPARPARPRIRPARRRSRQQPTPAAPAPSRQPAGDLGREIEIGTLDPAWTTPTLEVASDGEAGHLLFRRGRRPWRGGQRPTSGATGRAQMRRSSSGGTRGATGRSSASAASSERGRSSTAGFTESARGTCGSSPDVDAEPILLDTHPGDESVSSLVPSFAIHQGQIAWTAFDSGPDRTGLTAALCARARAGSRCSWRSGMRGRPSCGCRRCATRSSRTAR